MEIKTVSKELVERNLEYIRKHMPSYDEEDERRIQEFILPLIEEGTTEENFREKATQKDPNWTGRDFFLFDMLTQPNLPQYVQETKEELKKWRRILLKQERRKEEKNEV